MSVFVIAEAGANHDRNLNQALDLVRVAKESGADAVKFQTYSSETLYAPGAPNFAGYKNINKLIKDIELPREWQKEIKQYCDDQDIEFMSTPFDEKAVDELCNLGVKRLKIAGFESTDPRFVKMVASTGLPLIVTAGIGSNSIQIKNCLSWIKEVNPEPDVTILHGNNAYPTPLEDANIEQIGEYIRGQELEGKYPYRFKVGISDHTEGILVPSLAVAQGAEVVEKHFTISRALPGPDHPFAVEPDELREMVSMIRTASLCMGKKQDTHTESEKKFSNGQRSVVAKRDIYHGETLTEENITTMRPSLPGAIPAFQFYETLGNTPRRKIEKGKVIMKDDLV